MHAIKIDVVVPENRELRVTLPPEVPTGKAQVIVLSQNQAEPGTNVSLILQRGYEWRSKHPELLRAKSDIDRGMEEERASWGNDE